MPTSNVIIHIHQHTIKFYSINSIFQVLSPPARHARMRVCARGVGGTTSRGICVSWRMKTTSGAVLITTPDSQPSRLGHLNMFRVSPDRHMACMHAPAHSGGWHSSVGYSQPRVHELSTAGDPNGHPQWNPTRGGPIRIFFGPPQLPAWHAARAAWACIART